MNDNIRKKIQKRRKKHYALVILICVSALALSVFGYVMRNTLYSSVNYDPYRFPGLTLVLNGAREGIYPWSKPETNTGYETDPLPVTTDTDQTSESVPEQNTEPVTSEESSEIPSEITPEPEEVPYIDTVKEFIRVDDDYFNDALFIGDSRMVGLSEYCEPIYSRADFFVKRSMTVYYLLDGKTVSFNGEQKDLWTVLSEKEYGKIYITIGINEIGIGSPEYFQNAYADLLNRIRETQPDAYIFVVANMHVTTAKSNSDGLYNNPNINARNEVLIPLTDNIRTFYLNVNEAIDDEYGGMRADISYDEVHLSGSCHEPIHEYLLDHGVARP